MRELELLVYGPKLSTGVKYSSMDAFHMVMVYSYKHKTTLNPTAQTSELSSSYIAWNWQFSNDLSILKDSMFSDLVDTI